MEIPLIAGAIAAAGLMALGIAFAVLVVFSLPRWPE
jgi:hypothetical protein